MRRGENEGGRIRGNKEEGKNEEGSKLENFEVKKKINRVSSRLCEESSNYTVIVLIVLNLRLDEKSRTDEGKTGTVELVKETKAEWG